MSAAGGAGRRFVDLALGCGALRFGDFTLKSGRYSPYFLNVGDICSASALRELGEMYADAVLDLKIDGATLVGLPYKGIPLAALACAALAGRGMGDRFGFAYLRKEAKDHGEGGSLVGEMSGERPVVMVDDVLTAGTAATESINSLRSMGTEPIGLVVAYDRLENAGEGEDYASRKIALDFGIGFRSVATAVDLMNSVDAERARTIRDHLDRYAPSGDAVPSASA